MGIASCFHVRRKEGTGEERRDSSQQAWYKEGKRTEEGSQQR